MHVFAFSCVWLSGPHGLYSLPDSYVCGIFQASILEWVVISFSKGSFLRKDRICISCISCIGRWVLYQLGYWGSPQPWQKNSSSEFQILCSWFLLPVTQKSSQCTPTYALPTQGIIALCGLGQLSCPLRASTFPSINLMILRCLPFI